MVQIVLEELQRTGFRQDAAHDLFMTVQDFVERIRREVIARLQVEELAERKILSGCMISPVRSVPGSPSSAA